MKARVYFDPLYAWGRIRHYGVKRLLLGKLKYRPGPQVAMRKVIESAVVVAHPADFACRRRLARRVSRTSPWRGFIPQSTGYRITEPRELPGADAVVRECRKIYNQWRKDHKVETPDRLRYLNLLSSNPLGERRGVIAADLREHPEIQNFVLGPALSEITADYIGEVPVVATVQLLLSPPNVSLEGPQKLHLDYGAPKDLTTFLAINDVDEDCGPLSFFPANVSEMIRKKVDFRYKRLEDEIAFAIAGRDSLLKATGKAGTCAMVDTARCIHYGSRGNSKDRLVLQVRYMTRFSSSDHANALGLIRFDQSRQISPYQSLLTHA